MKRTLVIIMAVFLATVAVASGDELDDLLPLAADEPLRLSARQMIGVGINLDDVLALTRAMHQNRFTNAQAVTAQALVVGAAQKGLPTGPLMDKAYEGMVKKVPNDRIVAAIKTVRARYAFAYGQASAITANKENQRRIGNVIAAAMSAGLGQTDVATITSRLRDRSGRQSPSNSAALAALAAASFETSRDMVRTGVSSDSARDLVCEALQHNYDAHKIQALGQAFRTRSRMESPQGLAHRFTRSVGQGQDVPSAQNRSHTGSPGSLGNDGPLGNSGSSGRSGSQKGPDASAGPSSSGNAGGSENGNSSGSSGEAGSNGNSGGSNGSSNGSGNGGSVGSGGTHGGAKGAGGSGGSGI